MSGTHTAFVGLLANDNPTSSLWASWIPALQANIQQSATTLAVLMDDDQCDHLLASLREAQQGHTVSFMDAFDDC
jgi:hypothetical protein